MEIFTFLLFWGGAGYLAGGAFLAQMAKNFPMFEISIGQWIFAFVLALMGFVGFVLAIFCTTIIDGFPFKQGITWNPKKFYNKNYFDEKYN